ncbi:MAG: peptidase M19, partial [Novosphingobium sp.]|nr:peptidase M19 [Novosphingobium sp.]
MRGKIGWAVIFVVCFAALFVLGPLPAVVEKRMNVIDGKPLIAVSARARALHRTLTIVDLHSDTL